MKAFSLLLAPWCFIRSRWLSLCPLLSKLFSHWSLSSSTPWMCCLLPKRLSNWWIASHQKSMNTCCQKLICWTIKDGFPQDFLFVVASLLLSLTLSMPWTWPLTFPRSSLYICPNIWPCLSLFCIFMPSYSHFMLSFREERIIWL